MKSYRILCLLLSVVMLLSVVFPISVSADEFELVDEFVVQEDAGEYYDEEIIVEDYSYEPEYQTEDETIVYEEIDTVQDEAVQDEAIQDEAIQPEEIENSEPDAVVMELELVESEAFSTALAIVTEPTDCEAAEGSMATFTVEATGVKSYQWQYWSTNGTKWNNNSGDSAKTASFSIEAIEKRYGYKYRCKLTGEDGSVLYTDEVKIVKPAAFEIVTQPVNCEAAEGSMATFTVEATGVKTYQWQYWMPTKNKWTNNTGDTAVTASFSIEAIEKRYGYKYRCKLTGEDGRVLYTDEVQIVNPQIVIDGVTYKPLTETTCAAVAYDNDPSRTSLNIPKIVDNKYTVTEIGEANNSKGVFEGCTALTSINLPNDITVIHARAFKDCTNLSTMTTH